MHCTAVWVGPESWRTAVAAAALWTAMVAGIGKLLMVAAVTVGRVRRAAELAGEDYQGVLQ